MDPQARYEEIADDLAARNEWVVVPAAHADRWPDLAEQARITAT
jgi:hypothetical protein